MRTLSLLLPTTLFLLASSTSAQTLPYPRSSSETMSTVQVTAPGRTVRLKRDEARQITGTYDMSNGWLLKVRTAPTYIDATIDSEQPIRLQAVTSEKFVSNDGNVIMEFNRGYSGDEMIMSYVPDAKLAKLVVLSASMAMR
jgi:hypothetical protein